MSYEKTNWVAGDIVTAEKLNNIENGVANAGGVLIVHSQNNEGTYILDKTYTEIIEAMEKGIVLVRHSGNSMGASSMQGIVVSSDQSNEYDPSKDTYYDVYELYVMFKGVPYNYDASSEDDYPICYNE